MLDHLSEGGVLLSDHDSTLSKVSEFDNTERPDSHAEVGFHVHLTNFAGPFDLLLSLIAKHKLDITEIALAQVTDEFISYIRLAQDTNETGEALVGGDSSKNLGIISEFLLVAATLLDLKAARLLPDAEIDSEDAIELLEARDLLFAKLLQYRAFKELAAVFEENLHRQNAYVPRSVALEPRFAQVLPPLVWNLTPDKLHDLASRVYGKSIPVEPPTVAVTHLHNPRVGMADEIPFVLDFFARNPHTTFDALAADVDDSLQVIIRFLLMLEFYRDKALEFSQPDPLGELKLTFVGGEDYQPKFSDEYNGSRDSATTSDARGVRP